MHSAKAARLAIAGLVSGLGLLTSVTLSPAAAAPSPYPAQESSASQPGVAAAGRVVPQASSSPTADTAPSDSAPTADATPAPTTASSAPAVRPDKPSNTLTVVAIVLAVMISLGAATIALFRR